MTQRIRLGKSWIASGIVLPLGWLIVCFWGSFAAAQEGDSGRPGVLSGLFSRKAESSDSRGSGARGLGSVGKVDPKTGRPYLPSLELDPNSVPTAEGEVPSAGGRGLRQFEPSGPVPMRPVLKPQSAPKPAAIPAAPQASKGENLFNPKFGVPVFEPEAGEATGQQDRGSMPFGTGMEQFVPTGPPELSNDPAAPPEKPKVSKKAAQAEPDEKSQKIWAEGFASRELPTLEGDELEGPPADPAAAGLSNLTQFEPSSPANVGLKPVISPNPGPAADDGGAARKAMEYAKFYEGADAKALPQLEDPAETAANSGPDLVQFVPTAAAAKPVVAPEPEPVSATPERGATRAPKGGLFEEKPAFNPKFGALSFDSLESEQASLSEFVPTGPSPYRGGEANPMRGLKQAVVTAPSGTAVAPEGGGADLQKRRDQQKWAEGDGLRELPRLDLAGVDPLSGAAPAAAGVTNMTQFQPTGPPEIEPFQIGRPEVAAADPVVDAGAGQRKAQEQSDYYQLKGAPALPSLDSEMELAMGTTNPMARFEHYDVPPPSQPIIPQPQPEKAKRAPVEPPPSGPNKGEMPFNPKFGVPNFDPEEGQPKTPAPGKLATAAGGELAQFTPTGPSEYLEIPSKPKKVKAPETSGDAEASRAVKEQKLKDWMGGGNRRELPTLELEVAAEGINVDRKLQQFDVPPPSVPVRVSPGENREGGVIDDSRARYHKYYTMEPKFPMPSLETPADSGEEDREADDSGAPRTARGISLQPYGGAAQPR